MTTRWRLLATLVAAGALSLGLIAGCSDDDSGGGESTPQTEAPTSTSGGTDANDVGNADDGVTPVPDGEPGGTVVIGQDQAPDTLNGVLLAGNTVVTHQVNSAVTGENMFTFTPEFEYVPVLAERVPTVENGDLTLEPFTVTLRIKQEAAWSDKVPVTADDVVFSWQTIMNPRNKVTGRTGWELIDKIDVMDPKTVKVTFKEPYAPWQDLFSPSGGSTSQLLPKHVLQGKDFNTIWNRGGLIGTGPYILDSYTPDARAVLVKNPNYWNAAAGGPYVDRIVHVFLKETTTQQLQFTSGEVNFINPPDFSIRPQLAEVPDATVANPPGVTWEHLHFNTEDPVIGDPNVRRAIAYAIDPDELIAVTTENETKPLQSFLVPEQAPYYQPVFEKYNPDPAMVDQLLTASGYTKNANGFYEKDGQELNIEFATIAGNETRRQNFTLMKDQLEKVGIRMTPKFSENFFDAGGPLLSGNFQVGEFAFSSSADPSVTSIFSSDEIPTSANNFSGQNTFRLNDPAFDEVLSASDRAIEESERVELFTQIQQYIADNVVMFPLYQRPEVVAYANNLNNVLVNPTQVSHYDQTQRWFYTGGRAAR